MNKNVGSGERYLRIGLGIAAGASAILLPASIPIRVVLGAIGAAGISTGATQYCPMNAAFGVNRYEPARAKTTRVSPRHSESASPSRSLS